MPVQRDSQHPDEHPERVRIAGQAMASQAIPGQLPLPLPLPQPSSPLNSSHSHSHSHPHSLHHQQSPPVTLKQILINKFNARRSTLNIDPKSSRAFALRHRSFSIDIDHDIDTDDNQIQGSSEQFLNQNQPPQAQLDDHQMDNSFQSDIATTTITDRLRLWRDDARAQHLYQTAAFWGAKVYGLTSNPNDAFWLAQVYFLTGQFFRAEKILTGAKRVPRRVVPSSDSANVSDDNPELSFWDDVLPAPSTGPGESSGASGDEQMASVRMTDYSTACRYLAAQCMIRQGKWDAALEMVGEENPFRYCPSRAPPDHSPHASPAHNRSAGSTDQPGLVGMSKMAKKTYVEREAVKAAMDGGIKFEASMCYIRGLIHLQHKALDRAKECFLESLALDVKCYESFEALVGGNMLEPEQEWDFIRTLSYSHQTPSDALFIKSLYTVRLKKFNHQEEIFEAFRLLKEEFGLGDDPDAGFGLADWLFTNYRFVDCYRITSRTLSLHYHHSPTLPLHLTCMAQTPRLQPSLFLLAHELIERDPTAAVSWYGAGLWYFSQKRWEESRRFFSKSALLDSRFPWAWFAFGHALAYEGEHDQAITAYSTASHNFQGSHLPLLFIGMQHVQLANCTLAAEYLETASQICPFDPLVMHERGVVCYYEEQWEEAIKLFDQTIQTAQNSQTDPKIWCPTYLNLSHCYRRLQRFEEALRTAKEAKKLEPRQAVVLTAVGMAYHGLGERSLAIGEYHEALAVVPADPMATALLKLALEDEGTSQMMGTEAGRSPPAGRRLVGRLPRAAEEGWEGEVEAMEVELERVYGRTCGADRVLGGSGVGGDVGGVGVGVGGGGGDEEEQEEQGADRMEE